jgi:hypothetical protein
MPSVQVGGGGVPLELVLPEDDEEADELAEPLELVEDAELAEPLELAEEAEEEEDADELLAVPLLAPPLLLAEEAELEALILLALGSNKSETEALLQAQRQARLEPKTHATAHASIWRVRCTRARCVERLNEQRRSRHASLRVIADYRR